MGGDHGANDVGDAAAGEVVGFKLFGGHVEPGLDAGDFGEDDLAHIDFAEAHADEIEDGYVGFGHVTLEPQAA